MLLHLLIPDLWANSIPPGGFVLSRAGSYYLILYMPIAYEEVQDNGSGSEYRALPGTFSTGHAEKYE